MRIPIIGGSLDGKTHPVKRLEFKEKDESYMLIRFDVKDGDQKVEHFFYIKCNGPTVLEAMNTYKERLKAAGGKWPR